MSNQTVKVANIIEEGRLGGPQIRMVNVAAALSEHIETTIYMPVEDSANFQKMCADRNVNFRVHSISRMTKELGMAIRYVLFFPFEIISLARQFRKSGFNLVHISGGSWQYKGVLAGKMAGIKIIWHLNDSARPGFIKRIFHQLSRLASGFIYASKRTKQYYAPFVPESSPGFTVPAPVDTVWFDPGLDISPLSTLGDELKGKLVIGTVANVNPVKNLELFIAVAHKLNQKIDNLAFVVVGQVFDSQIKYFQKLQGQCRSRGISNLYFAGMNEDVRPFLKRFDVYVCTSHAESSPLSVWEALSMGKPVVSTDVGDVSLYVKDKINGFIVDTGEEKALVEKLSVLINNQKLRMEFGKKGRDIAVKELDITICANKHLNAYNAVLAANGTL